MLKSPLITILLGIAMFVAAIFLARTPEPSYTWVITLAIAGLMFVDWGWSSFLRKHRAVGCFIAILQIALVLLVIIGSGIANFIK